MLAKLCDLYLLGLLGSMRMVGAGVDLQLPVHRISHLGFRQHAANRFLDQAYWLLLAHDRGTFLAQPTFESAVISVNLLILFAAGQLDLRRVHDDDVIAGVDERGIGRLVLALEKARRQCRDAAEHLALRVDDMPPAICALRACYERPHEKGFLTWGDHDLAADNRKPQ